MSKSTPQPSIYYELEKVKAEQARKRSSKSPSEIREQYRITENINNLRRHGYTVIPPQKQTETEVSNNG